MRDRVYLLLFILIVGALLYLGRDAIRSSELMAWGLTFGGTTAIAILIVAMYRFRIQLEESRHELARKDAEIGFALKVQQALFPRSFPTGRGLDFAAVCIPARGISGDYYDAFFMPDGGLAFAIADVSGKGISAAILMANLQALLRAVSLQGTSPAQVCKMLNDHLCQVTQASQFATLFYARWDPATRMLRYVNAGHNPPLLVNTAAIQLLTTGGMPLGMFPEAEYGTGETCLNVEDLIVLYSDGITEAGQSDGRDFGEERLTSLVKAIRGLSLLDIQARILASIRAWTSNEPEDDMTLVLVRALTFDSSSAGGVQ